MPFLQLFYHSKLDFLQNLKVNICFSFSGGGKIERIERKIQRHIPVPLFDFGTFDSFLAGLGRNWVYRECCPDYLNGPLTSSEKQTTEAKTFLP